MIPRRVALLGLAVLLLGGAGIAAAVTHDDGDDMPAALDRPAETTTAAAPFTLT